jgi:hypothetical protein
MAVYALLCLAPALLLKELAKDETRATNHTARPSSLALDAPRRGLLFRLASHRAEIVASLIILQFALGVYNPFRFIPSAAMRQSGEALIARIAAIDGEVWVMQHPYYALLAGKQPSAQIAIVWHSRERGVLPLPDDLVRRIQTRYYAAIISDESLFEIDPPLAELIAANYVRSEELAATESPPTLTGMAVRPRVVYVPKK